MPLVILPVNGRSTYTRALVMFLMVLLSVGVILAIMKPQLYVEVSKKFLQWKTSSTHQPLSDDFIEQVNEKTNIWQAGRNFDESSSMDTIKRMMGTLNEPGNLNYSIYVRKHSSAHLRLLPTNFDARTNWPQCETIGEIRDQGGCGSCWAVAAAETMSDRFCIENNKNFRFSAEDILSCCRDCGFGCRGGFPFNAFGYWKHHGVVSGGVYNSTEGCISYEIPPCQHHTSNDRPKCHKERTPKCMDQCQNGSKLSYKLDKNFAREIYAVHDEASILKELVTNGPLEGTFDVYEDFLHYKSGIYHYVQGKYLGGHAIKVIGYGIEESVPYYLCSNSWNYDWGDGGFFKIVRYGLSFEMISGISETS